MTPRLATFTIFGWGAQTLWVHHSDPVVSVRIEQCRTVIKGVKCTGVWRSADGSEKRVHIDDGGYYFPGKQRMPTFTATGDTSTGKPRNTGLRLWVYWPGFGDASACRAVAMLRCEWGYWINSP